MQEYRDAQLARRNIRLPHDRAATLPGQNGRQHHKPRQRTRYCPPKYPVAARPRRKRTYHEPGQNDRQHLKLRQRTRHCPRTGTGTMQEYRDARCPPKCPVAARPGGSACATSPDQVHREVQNTAIRVAGVKIFYSERPAVMLANTSRYAAGAGCRIILFRFRPLNKQLNWLPFPSILR